MVGNDRVESAEIETSSKVYAEAILLRYGQDFFKRWAAKYANFLLARDYLVGADPKNTTFKAWAATGTIVELDDVYDVYFYEKIKFK